MLSRFTRRTFTNLKPFRAFSTKIKIELKSGRVGVLELADQEQLDKVLERSAALGMVEDGDADPIKIVTQMNQVDQSKIYHLAFGFDESEVFDEEEYEEGEENV